MSSSIVIEAKNIAKTYRLYKTPAQRLFNILNPKLKNYKKVEALKNVSFQIRSGEKVALIGDNGSGKSTLLQIVSAVLYPTSGSLESKGVIAPLLELGAGFNIEYTGLENLYMNAAILGMSRKEIDQKKTSIIEFSELGDAIDHPVKTYSSGMFLRLAFSIAISTNPDILIADEILAVGDESFQKKCLNRIKELQRQGTTTIIVSHNLDYVMNNCDTAIWLEKGELKKYGQAKDVCEVYRLSKSEAEDSNPGYSVVNVKCEPNQENFTVQDHANLRFTYDLKKKSEDLFVGINIINESGIYVAGIDSEQDNFALPDQVSESNTFVLSLDLKNLLTGRYFVNIVFMDNKGRPISQDLKSLCSFYVENSAFGVGAMFMSHSWSKEVS